MTGNSWYTVARTSDKECVGRVSFSLGSSELVFDVLIQFGNYSLSIVSASVTTVFAIRIRSHGGFSYVDLRADETIEGSPSVTIQQYLNTLSLLSFALAGSGKQECIVSTDSYTPVVEETYVTIDQVEVINALKYFADGLAIGDRDNFWAFTYSQDGVYLGGKRILITDDLIPYATQSWVLGKGYITAAALTGYVNDGAYNSATKYIELKHDDTVVAQIDARAFIKDGMVDSVVIEDGYLVITFNTDSGKEPISISLIDIFNPANYYTKTDIDTILGGYVTLATKQTITGEKYFSNALALPLAAPSSPTSGMSYLYAGTGSYAEEPGGGGGGGGELLTVTKNGSAWLSYDGSQAVSLNLVVPTALSDLTSDSTHRLVTDTQIGVWNAKYDKPSGGIPKTDLASDVQTSLGKADTALQSFTETDPTVPAWAKKSSLAASDVPTLAISKISGLQDALDGKQPLDTDLTAIAALTGSGLLRRSSNNTWSLDTNTYLTSSDHKALTLKVGTITIGSDFNSLAAKTYTITKANLTDTIGSTTYAPYNADGYLPLSAGYDYPLTDTLYSQSILPTANNAYLLGDSSHRFGLGAFGILSSYIAATLDMDVTDMLSIPQSAPDTTEDFYDSTKSYLWADSSGNYAVTPSGGGVANIYDLYIKRGGVRVGPYDLGEQDQTADISSLFTGYATEAWVTSNFNNYTLPIASASTLGGIKVGAGLTIDANGVLTPYVVDDSMLVLANDGTLGVNIEQLLNFSQLVVESYGYATTTALNSAVATLTPKTQAIPYIVGPSTDTTAGTWTGTYDGITAYSEGLTIIYVPNVAGASTTKLNINGLGAVTCYYSGTSKMTTHYPVGTPILLTYRTISGTAGWRRADYDSNTNTYIRIYRQTTGYDGDYPIIVSRTQTIGTAGSNGSYTAVYGVVGDTNIPTINPMTGLLKATTFQGALDWSYITSKPTLGTAAPLDSTSSITSGGTGLPTAGAVYTYVNNAITAAQPYKGVSTTAITDGGTEMPTISGYTTRTKGDVVAYNKKEFIWEGAAWRELGDEGSYALKTTSVLAGTGLTGGGQISQDVTVSLNAASIASLALADTAVQPTRKVNGHPLSADVTVTKGDVGLGNVENTALSTWAGTSNITTLGTITTGVWNGTQITNSYLANSSVTINTHSLSLGGSLTLKLSDLTDDILSGHYLPLGGGTMTGTINTQDLLPKTTATYDLGSSNKKFQHLYLSGDAQIGSDTYIGGALSVTHAIEGASLYSYGDTTIEGNLEVDQEAELYDAKITHNLAIPSSAPTGTTSGLYYLWYDTTGNYSETPSGGGGGGGETLTITKNGSAWLSYNGSQAVSLNLAVPTALSDLTADSTHRLVTDTQISTWDAKQNAISDLATIRSNASTAATAVDVQQGSCLAVVNGHLTVDTQELDSEMGFGAAAYKGVATSVASGNTNLVTSGAVYTAIQNASPDLSGYLPLTAGSGKALTGDLYFATTANGTSGIKVTDSTNTTRTVLSIEDGGVVQLQSSSSTQMRVYGGTVRLGTNGTNGKNVYLAGTGYFYADNNTVNLGSSANKWISVWATTLNGNLALSYLTGADDLKAIEALAGTSGFLKKTAANTWSLDTSTYLTSVAFSDLTAHPTTLSGYGITDAYTKTEADTEYAKYLPLTGGTMANTNLVTNMNADLIDGLHSHEQRRLGNAKDNLGTNAIAYGYNAEATGARSTAIGQVAVASGEDAVALGRATTASGNHARAMAYNSIASAKGALALGFGSQATAEHAIAAGFASRAVGQYSIALSNYSYAGIPSGDSSKPYCTFSYAAPSAITYNGNTVYGIWNRYNDATSVTFTYNGTSYTVEWPSASPTYWRHLNVIAISGDMLTPSTTSPYNVYSVTDDNQRGTNALVMQTVTELTTGVYAIVSGTTSTSSTWADLHPMVTATTKVGRWSKSTSAPTAAVVLGGTAVACNSSAFALGSNSLATGGSAVAFGLYAKANGSSSFAMGSYAIANGVYSFAMGYGASAIGNNSVASGLYAVAANEGAYVTARYGMSGNIYQTVLGRNNAVVSSMALVVGWGTDTTPANIMTLSTAGLLNTTGGLSTAGTLSVTGATTLSSTLGVTGVSTFTGNLVPNTTNATDIGSSSKKFKDIYSIGTIYADGSLSIPTAAPSNPDSSKAYLWVDTEGVYAVRPVYAFNQILQNGNFESTSGWSIPYSGPTRTVANNILTLTVGTSNNYRPQVYHNFAAITSGHKLYYTYTIRITTSSPASQRNAFLYSSSGSTYIPTTYSDDSEYASWKRVSGIITTTRAFTRIYVGRMAGSSAPLNTGDTVEIKNVWITDLTEMYGEGNEPTVAEFEAFYPGDYYDYQPIGA